MHFRPTDKVEQMTTDEGAHCGSSTFVLNVDGNRGLESESYDFRTPVP